MAIGFHPMVQQLTHLGFEERRAVLLDATKLSRFRALRGVYLLGAILLIGLGVAGISIPGFPGTIFLIIALWFAGRSNERLYRWMLTNRLFGRQLVDYESGFGIPRRIKYLIAVVIAGFTTLALVSVDTTWVLVLDGVLAVYGIWYVWTRPTREDVVATLAAST